MFHIKKPGCCTARKATTDLRCKESTVKRLHQQKVKALISLSAVLSRLCWPLGSRPCSERRGWQPAGFQSTQPSLRGPRQSPVPGRQGQLIRARHHGTSSLEGTGVVPAPLLAPRSAARAQGFSRPGPFAGLSHQSYSDITLRPRMPRSRPAFKST